MSTSKWIKQWVVWRNVPNWNTRDRGQPIALPTFTLRLIQCCLLAGPRQSPAPSATWAVQRRFASLGCFRCRNWSRKRVSSFLWRSASDHTSTCTEYGMPLDLDWKIASRKQSRFEERGRKVLFHGCCRRLCVCVSNTGGPVPHEAKGDCTLTRLTRGYLTNRPELAHA